jgi:hypothetical protein
MLLNFVLSSMPTYFFTVLAQKKVEIKKIDKIIRGFFVERGRESFWGKLYLERFNKALQNKPPTISDASGASHAASPLGQLAQLTRTNPQMNPHNIGGSMRVKLLSPHKPAYPPASLVSPASHNLAAAHGEPYLCPAPCPAGDAHCPAGDAS